MMVYRRNAIASIRLSICIPIYNFGEYIGDTLESIISQATEEVEIVIVDGGSTDDTQDIVRSFKNRFERINYYRFEVRGGIDEDMAKTVKYAKGEYCWLFGGDDIMAKGAIERILRELKTGCDLYLCESMLCDLNLVPMTKHKMLNINTSRVFDLGDKKQRQIYFGLANNTAAFFSFCSSLVINKARWDSEIVDEQFIGSHWAHAARILGMISKGITVKYIPEYLLYKRGDNDSFMDKGMVNRYEITIYGYNRIADTIFVHDSEEAFHIRRSIRDELTIKHLLNLKLVCRDSKLHGDRKRLDQLAAIHYSDSQISNKIGYLAYRFTPMAIYKSLKMLKKGMKAKAKMEL